MVPGAGERPRFHRPHPRGPQQPGPPLLPPLPPAETVLVSARMPSDGTIGGLVGKLAVLRVECPTCGRQGPLSRRADDRGAGAQLPTDRLAIRAHRRLSAEEPSRGDASMWRGHAGPGRPTVMLAGFVWGVGTHFTIPALRPPQLKTSPGHRAIPSGRASESVRSRLGC